MEHAIVEHKEVHVGGIAPRVPELRIALSSRPVVGLVQIASEAAVDQVLRTILAALAARPEMVDSHFARRVGFPALSENARP
jgi:hypothetical protein